jgi:hypothetical protein
MNELTGAGGSCEHPEKIAQELFLVGTSKHSLKEQQKHSADFITNRADKVHGISLYQTESKKEIDLFFKKIGRWFKKAAKKVKKFVKKHARKFRGTLKRAGRGLNRHFGKFARTLKREAGKFKRTIKRVAVKIHKGFKKAIKFGLRIVKKLHAQ